MIKGKTSSGFNFELDERRMSDVRVIDAIALIDGAEDDMTRLRNLSILRTVMLGEEYGKKLLDYVHNKHKEDDLIPADEVMAELTEIIKIMGEKSSKVKNS